MTDEEWRAQEAANEAARKERLRVRLELRQGSTTDRIPSGKVYRRKAKHPQKEHA